MPSTPPEGEPVPADGSLPPASATAVGQAPFGVYVHVPFCATRCGYCDFNTYTATELGGGASQPTYADSALAELRLARAVLGEVDLPVATVFVGGGTPTLLPVTDLARLLAGVRDTFGLAADAEVTTEANPDSVTPQSLEGLREAGFTRVSFGMQSAVPSVLATLERTHDPRRLPDVVGWARAAGFGEVSLDLIYGTPGERAQDWQASLEAALAMAPDHVSAYALVVEDGTALAARVRRGEVPGTDEDDLAEKYLAAEAALSAAGLSWYEVSNWARTPASACRHNLAYWRSHDWWGVGPGAHSHVAGTRWWNRRHPRAYAEALAQGRSPGQAREVLDATSRQVEHVLLGVRLSDGLPLADLEADGAAAVPELVAQGLVERVACKSDARISYARLTDAGYDKLDCAGATHVAGIQRLFLEHFSPAELDQLAGLLGRLPGALRDGSCTVA